jgi:hypothetical protein
MFQLLKQGFDDIVPDSYTYEIVLRSYSRGNRPDAGKCAIRLFEEMRTRKEFQPTLVFYAELLSIVSKSYATDRENEEWAVIIEDIVSKHLQDVPKSVWHEHGDTFCSRMCSALKGYKAPHWEQTAQKIQDLRQQHCYSSNNLESKRR